MISLIIPVLNESKALPKTLDSLFQQQGEFEVILVDGGSSDNTVAIAESRSGIQVLHTEPGRAKQMNAGAAAATGELLLFLHADTLLPADALAHLNTLEAASDIKWGGFHHRFSGRTWALRLISWLHNTRCKLSGVFYGDQAMFVRRDYFFEHGGFPDVGILEDIKASDIFLTSARPEFLPLTVTTDSRKFEQMGSWRSLGRCFLIILCSELKLPVLGKKFFAPIR